MDYFAHAGQLLISHLDDVGVKAAEFAAKFDAGQSGLLAGRLHDLGKAETEFQIRINSNDKKGIKKPHAHHGAALAIESQAWPIALAVNGHHAGLHDRGNVDRICAEYLPKAKSCIVRLKERHPEWQVPAITEPLPTWLSALPFDQQRKAEGWFATDVFTRFLYSALVDADSLDAEQHEQGKDASIAARKWPLFAPEEWLAVLRANLSVRSAEAQESGSASPEVQTVWTQVSSSCLAAALTEPGLFSLTVPTGGGKTLASMLFALSHAAHHNSLNDRDRFRRIVVVIPYLSIIQQTIEQLRGVFGDGVVLEHHSQADEPDPKSFKGERVDGKIDEGTRRRRLAAENWDAPIVVTTSVQFFNSLFSRRRSAARKLHNLCQSIVIFDEIQTLPPLLLQPILSVLAELTRRDRPYGCSMVFCTATQPALGRSEDLPCGLDNVRPIVPPETIRSHFQMLDRVEYYWPSEGESFTWEQLANKIVGDPAQNDQRVLVVVNTRQAARDLHAVVASRLRNGLNLAERAPIDGLFHLSTWMIPAHRNEVLDEVRARLDPPKPIDDQSFKRCILISTQCIEAGVDVDFPEVWRAFGPYDSIVQAAGRCNRRGLRDKGIVHVFQPAESKIPPGLYGTATSQTDLLRRIGRAIPADPDSFADYFRLLYQLSVPDECLIQKERAKLHFEQVDELFTFIDTNTFPLLVLGQRLGEQNVEFEKPKNIYEAAKQRGFFVREDWRQLQPYIINLLQSSRSQPTFSEYITPAFVAESGLYIWVGNYIGGSGGVGIVPLIPEDYIL